MWNRKMAAIGLLVVLFTWLVAAGAVAQEQESDAPADAVPVPVGDVVKGHMDTRDDIDYFTFTTKAEPGWAYNIEITNISVDDAPFINDGVLPMLRYYLCNVYGEQLYGKSDLLKGGTGVMEYQFEPDTAYYLCIMHSSRNSTGMEHTGEYSISIQAVADDFSNTLDGADGLPVGTLSAGEELRVGLQGVDDVDCFRVSGEGMGESFVISAENIDIPLEKAAHTR